MQRNLELERAIVAAPHDPQPWSVYADWLQSRGDAWGERITLELAREKASASELAAILARLAQLDRRHRVEMFGEAFAKLVDHEDLDTILALEWRYGFVVGVRVADYEDGTELAVGKTLRALLDSPASCLLQYLTLGITDARYPTSLRSGLDAIAAGPVLEHLRELFLGDFAYPEESEISWVKVGDITQALARCPNLVHLHVRGAEIELGDALVHPTLESLTIETGGLPAPAVAAIGRCRLPKLHTMKVWLGQNSYGGEGSIDQLAPLFEGEGLPALRHLGLMNSDFEDDIAVALTNSAILPRLTSVSLAMGVLRQRGGRALLAATDRLRHLERLDLDFNWLRADLAEALEHALPCVHIGERNEPSEDELDDEDDDDFYYYTQVGE